MGAHKTLWGSSKVDEIINLFGEAEIGAICVEVGTGNFTH